MDLFKVGQDRLIVSKLGHFTAYDVNACHVTSYGYENLSLLGNVTIHEMIRSLNPSTDSKKMVGFLVNDITDSETFRNDDRLMTVYSLQGVLISREATLKNL